MNTFKIDQNWLAELIPEGITYPSKTVITGPAGSGKPIIGNMLATSWLKNGGTVILLLLNSNRAFAERLLNLYQIDPDKVKNNIIFVKLNPEIDSIMKVKDDEYTANLVRPEVWDQVINLADNFQNKTNIGTMISGSSLNMLLFSKTYGGSVLKKIKQIMTQTHCVFCITNNVFEKEMKQIEKFADNLIYAHASGIMHLNLKIIRMKDVSFSNKEVRVPLSEAGLEKLLLEGQKARQNYIPIIRKI